MDYQGNDETRCTREQEGRWKHKDNGGKERLRVALTAGHGTLAEVIGGVVLASHGRFPRRGLSGVVGARLGVAVRHTHATLTAAGFGFLKSGGPERRPEQDGGEQTHPCARFSSRSDRKMTARFHA